MRSRDESHGSQIRGIPLYSGSALIVRWPEVGEPLRCVVFALRVVQFLLCP